MCSARHKIRWQSTRACWPFRNESQQYRLHSRKICPYASIHSHVTFAGMLHSLPGTLFHPEIMTVLEMPLFQAALKSTVEEQEDEATTSCEQRLLLLAWMSLELQLLSQLDDAFLSDRKSIRWHSLWCFTSLIVRSDVKHNCAWLVWGSHMQANRKPKQEATILIETTSQMLFSW